MILFKGNNLVRIGVLYGKQLGAYFGNSLTCVDLNGNQLDDLVIGAPLHSKYENNVEGKYETGRVYVFYVFYFTRLENNWFKLVERIANDGR